MLHDLSFMLSCLAFVSILASIAWNRKKGRPFFTVNWIDVFTGLSLTGSWGVNLFDGGSVYRMAGNGIVAAFGAAWTVFIFRVLATGRDKEPTDD